MGVRNELAEMLTPLLPKGWKVYPYSTDLDVISQPVVMLALKSVKRNPAAPQSGHVATFTVTVVEPKTAPKDSQDGAEDKLLALLQAIDTLPPSVRWTDSQAVMFSDTNRAWDIDLEVQTQLNHPA